MRKVYKDPKELAACLKDLVDFYLDGIMPYEKLKEKITILLDANKDRIYKNGKISLKISLKISNIIGISRVAIIDNIFFKRQN
ncbi:TIGR04540 family protein [Clostridium sp.]|uniref:TIGR04540 family protein n=1 Tax=Clostridium sp. TaxID=1506 RepID=UPI001A55978D|nr:TIGR04540 family protein [Clostridium sp.]MBK5235146.1 TIGR04540 family protein [Clostridium sp.]